MSFAVFPCDGMLACLDFQVGMVRFDWRELPHMADINEITSAMAQPLFHEYDDHSDSVVWIIADRALTKAELDRAYAALENSL